MQRGFVTLSGRIDRRSPRNKGEMNSPLERINLLSRDGRNKKVQGTERLTAEMSGEPKWIGRYYSIETGINSPKTLVYTNDGKMHVINMIDASDTVVETAMAINARPRAWSYKLETTTTLYLVDGTNLWSFNGNNNNVWIKENLVDADGNSVTPIDITEHKDRLLVLTPTKLMVSSNLAPTNFTDPNDSLETIVGSGKGRNIAFGKINNQETLYLFTTEGIFGLFGDVISAVASTWEVRLVDEKRAISAGGVVDVERAINFVCADGEGIELWSFDGTSSKMLSYSEKLNDFITPKRNLLENMAMTYEDNYCKLSFTETGDGLYNSMEFWWDALENKIDIVKGRNVACYMQTDTAVEEEFKLIGRSESNLVMWADRGRNFDGEAIEFKLRSRDITPVVGNNQRFLAFRPEIVGTGERTVLFRYLIDGRLSDPGVGTLPANITNNDLEIWTAGVPNGWTKAQTVTQESGTENVYNGYSSAKIEYNILGSYIQYSIGTSYNGRKLRVNAYIKCSTASRAYLSIRETVGGTTYNRTSINHSGSGAWERLSAVWTINDSATAVDIRAGIAGGAATGYFDSFNAYCEKDEQANWLQSLSGETMPLGFINIANQGQFLDRVQPRINFSRGQSVAFEIYSKEVDSEFEMLGIGYDYIDKGSKKTKKVGA